MDLGRGRGGDLGFLGGGRARGTPDVRARAVDLDAQEVEFVRGSWVFFFVRSSLFL